MANDTDIKAHEATYTGMIGWLKWGAVVVFIITAIVIFVIAS